MRFFMLLSAVLAFSVNSAPQQFLVFGDMPYTPIDEALLSAPDGQLYQAVQQTPHLFMAHVGDIKSGGVPCTDDVLQRSFATVTDLSPMPLAYTPGDNDWTDCDRPTLTPGFDELERLSYVRQQFAQTQLPLPQFQRQAQLPENQAWRIDDVQYLTLHVVGTNNGRAQIYKSQASEALAQVQLRDTLNEQWLSEHTHSDDVSAIVIFFQADIYQRNNYGRPCNSSQQQQCDGLVHYQALFDELAQRSNKPVLVVHGDTAEFCFSQRESGLWHLNAPGDFRVLDIAKVRVNDAGNTPFVVSTLLGQVTIPQCK